MELEWFLRIRLLSRAFSCIVQFCRQSFEREDFPLKLLSELEVARSRSGILSLGEGGPLPGHWLSQEDNAPWGRAAWAPWVLSSLCYSPPGAPLPQLCQPQMSPHIAIVPGEGGVQLPPLRATGTDNCIWGRMGTQSFSAPSHGKMESRGQPPVCRQWFGVPVLPPDRPCCHTWGTKGSQEV